MRVEPAAHGAHAQRTVRRAALLGLVGLASPRLLEWGCSFVGSSLASARGGVTQLRAMERVYNPILRRDLYINKNMQRYITQQEKSELRQGTGSGDVSDRAAKKKAAYLAKLGIKPKERDAWDCEHMKAGDNFAGFVEHPDFGRVDLTVNVNSYDEVTWSSKKGEFEETATMRQDHPIGGKSNPEQRKYDIAAYIFSKFNFRWRDFENMPPITIEDVEHIDLPGLQLWFELVASVKGYPAEEEFKAACTDPSKGMSREDFVKFTDEDPTYLDVTLPTHYTGRKIKIFDSELELDGDFSSKARGFIFGYATYKGKPGGEFTLSLVK